MGVDPTSLGGASVLGSPSLELTHELVIEVPHHQLRHLDLPGQTSAISDSEARPRRTPLRGFSAVQERRISASAQLKVLGVFDHNREESAAHGDGELVEEPCLAQDHEELGIPWFDESDVGLPCDELVVSAISVQLKVYLDKGRGDGTATDTQFQGVRCVCEVDA
jgi:hypothetical protein